MLPQRVERRPRAGGRRLVRLVCPSYPAFNIYSRPARVMTALGPVCVATAIHDVPGWDVEVIDENNYRNGPTTPDGQVDHRALQAERPADVVGLYGGLTSTIPRLLEIARLYGQMGVTTLAGGQHFLSETIPDALAGGVDLIVRGEGEKTIVDVLAWLDGRIALAEIDGLSYLDADRAVVNTPDREPLCDFDALGIPDFSVLRYAKLRVYPVSGVRGCGMDCEFCTVKGRPRRSTPQRMLAQFTAASERWGAKRFFVVDDLFGQNRAETLELCRLLRDYQDRTGRTFLITVQIRLDRATDAELLEAMWSAGVRTLAVGYESPIAEELQAMNKRLDPARMVELTRLYRKAGFFVHGMFIFGYPMPPDVRFEMPVNQRVRRFRKFIRAARLDTVQVLLPVPLPGTELTERLGRDGRIYPTSEIGLEYYDGNFPVFEPDSPLTPEEMHQGLRRIMGRFYSPRNLLSIALNVLTYPWIAPWLSGRSRGRARWSRRWWMNIYRAGGWLTLRMWTAALKREPFARKLLRSRLTAREGS